MIDGAAVLSPAPCAECGYQFDERPEQIARRCTEFASWTTGILSSEPLSAVVRRRPSQAVWSPLEYAAHVSEVLPWYGQRIRLVLDQDSAQLSGKDWDEAALEGRYGQRASAAVAVDLQRACRDFARLARSLRDEDLTRTGLGSDGSARTVDQLLARAGHELAHHQRDIREGIPT